MGTGKEKVTAKANPSVQQHRQAEGRRQASCRKQRPSCQRLTAQSPVRD